MHQRVTSRHHGHQPKVGHDDPEHDPGPFRHHRLMVILALPNLLFVFVLTGKSLVVVLTVAAAILCSLNYSGTPHIFNVEVYMISYSVCHVLIMYSSIPLVWLSLANIVLITLVSVFLVLTAAWGALFFTEFRVSQSDVLLSLERLLLGVYPCVCVALWTWQTCWIIPPACAAFVIMAYGFVVMQVVTSPHIKSSFSVQTDDGIATPEPIYEIHTEDDRHSILTPYDQSLLCLLFCFAPSYVHIMTSIFLDFWALFTLATVMRVPFIFACSMFLASFLHMDCLFEHFVHETLQKYQSQIRPVSAAVVTLLISPVLYTHSVSSELLWYLPVVVCVHAAFGVTLAYRQYRNWSVPAAMLCCLLGAILMYRLPWSIKYNTSHLSIQIVYIVMLTTWCVGVYCVYSFTHNTVQHSSVAIAAHKLLLTGTEISLLQYGLYSHTALTLLTFAYIYLIFMLHERHKISNPTAVISLSLDVTKLSFIITSLLPMYKPPALYHYLLVYGLVTLTVYLVFNRHLIHNLRRVWMLAWVYVLVLYSVLSTSLPTLLSSLSALLFGQQISNYALLGLWMLLMGMSGITISTHHPTILYTSVAAVVAGGTLAFGYPQLALTMTAAFQWITTINIPCIGYVVMARRMHKVGHLVLLSLSAAPMAVYHFVSQIYGEYDTATLWLFTLIIAYILSTVLITYRASTTHYNNNLLFYGDTTQQGETTHQRETIHHNITATAIICVLICVYLKIYSIYTNKSLPTQVGQKETITRHLPLIANIYTFIAYITVCLASPYQQFYHDLWICWWTTLFFCIQSDNIRVSRINVKRLTNAPVLMSLLLVGLCALYRSVFWTDSSIVAMIFGFAEVLTIVSTLPVYFVFYGILWLDNTLLLSPLIVVFLLPLYPFLFVIGSSPTSWLFGACGLAAGSWMMHFKLPLGIKGGFW